MTIVMVEGTIHFMDECLYGVPCYMYIVYLLVYLEELHVHTAGLRCLRIRKGEAFGSSFLTIRVRVEDQDAGPLVTCVW